MVMAFFCLSQEQAEGNDNVSTDLDTIIKLGQRKMIVNVTGVGKKYVYYTENKSSSEKQSIERDKVQKIIYSDQSIEVFNSPVVEMVNEKSWQTVLVTEEEGQVEGLYEICKVKAESSSNVRSIRAARKSAEIRLQKKAVHKGANVVLITHTEAKGGFGDIPAYSMEGVAYSFTPPPETGIKE
jgi:ribosomal protein L19E